VIVTSHAWDDDRFAQHQSTPQGANAYMRWPFDADAMYSMIEAVFGGSIPASEASKLISLGGADATRMAGPGSSPSIPTAADTNVSQVLTLEEPSSIMSVKASEPGGLSLSLEMPEGFGDAISPVEAAALPEAPADPATNTHGTGLEIAPLEITGAGAFSGGSDATAEAATRVAPPAELSAAMSSVLAQAGAASPAVEEEPSPVSEAEAARDMPYLFQKTAGAAAGVAASVAPTAAAFALPLGDAVVPGGAAQSPDSETLKKYLLLREQDVAVLSTQLKAAKEQIQALENRAREEQNKGAELAHANEGLQRKVDEAARERQQAIDGLQAEIAELRFQLKAKGDKARLLDVQVREAADETERLKERVRMDIRRIRVREKELENRLEIMKKDSEALIAARENKIIELKRKLDLLEFNMDLLQDQHAREKETASKLRERLAKAAQVVRVAGGLLDNPGAARLAAEVLNDGDGDEVA
jgi:hypothetical protein